AYAVLQDLMKIKPHWRETYGLMSETLLGLNSTELARQGLIAYAAQFRFDLTTFERIRNPPKAWKDFANTDEYSATMAQRFADGEASIDEVFFLAFNKFLEQSPGNPKLKGLAETTLWFEHAVQMAPENLTSRALRGYLRLLKG